MSFVRSVGCVCVCVCVFRRVLVCEGQRLLHVWCRSRSVEEVRNKRKLEVYNPTRSLPSIPSAGGGGATGANRFRPSAYPPLFVICLSLQRKKYSDYKKTATIKTAHMSWQRVIESARRRARVVVVVFRRRRQRQQQQRGQLLLLRRMALLLLLSPHKQPEIYTEKVLRPSSRFLPVEEREVVAVVVVIVVGAIAAAGEGPRDQRRAGHEVAAPSEGRGSS